MPDLQPVFAELRRILAPYAEGMDVKKDSDTELYLDSRPAGKGGKPQFFGAVQVKKTYVSFHLMPVYAAPELLEPVSPALRKRMQG